MNITCGVEKIVRLWTFASCARAHYVSDFYQTLWCHFHTSICYSLNF